MVNAICNDKMRGTDHKAVVCHSDAEVPGDGLFPDGPYPVSKPWSQTAGHEYCRQRKCSAGSDR
jgi:hypothetical protein